MNVAQAKELLRVNGFYAETLWSIHDVQLIFKCNEEQALEILRRSLTNEATVEQIQFSIREFGEIAGYEKFVRDSNGVELNINDKVKLAEAFLSDEANIIGVTDNIVRIDSFIDENELMCVDSDGDYFSIETNWVTKVY